MESKQPMHENNHHHRRHRWKFAKNAKTTFVRIGRRMPAVLYEPFAEDITPETDHRNIAVLVMHSDEDYLSCPTGEELAKRGFLCLCANVPAKEGILFTQNEKMKAVQEGILFLRSLPMVQKVVLMGHSGGASLLSAYQCMAEAGPLIFSGPERLYPWRAEKPLAPADGIMFLDANWGNALMQLFSLDPAVTREDSGKDLDPAIDLFTPENGFDPNGSTYSADFIHAFQRAQADRNKRLLTLAEERLAALDAGVGFYDDDEPFIIPGAAQSFFNNRLFAQDIRLMSRTRGSHKLLHADGSITEEIVHSVRHAENPVSMTGSYREGARYLTVRTFLSSYAVRTTSDFGYDADTVYGVDWDSTYAAAPSNVPYIHVPTLVAGMTGGWEAAAAETIYDRSVSGDKDLIYIEGASHKFHPAKDCEKTPGQFGDTVKTLHDYVADWLLEGRFD